MMNQEIKSKWLTALRSGEYKQGVQYLEHNGEFCCLGVLSDIAAKENAVSRVYSNGLAEFGKNENSVLLADEVVKWAGLDNSHPCIGDGKDDECYLAVMNDRLGYSFCQIADIIEEQL